MTMNNEARVAFKLIDPRRIFLVSGQLMEQKVGGREGVSAAVTQRIVHAENSAAAVRTLAEAEPSFQLLGMASLHDYEDAARRMRAVLEGRSVEWLQLGEAARS